MYLGIVYAPTTFREKCRSPKSVNKMMGVIQKKQTHLTIGQRIKMTTLCNMQGYNHSVLHSGFVTDMFNLDLATCLV